MLIIHLVFFLLEQILSEASSLLSVMTDKEHGQVMRLASILLLGFLLPQSTGNEFFLLQNVSSTENYMSWSRQHPSNSVATSENASSETSNNNNLSRALSEYVLSMPLAERLESIPHQFYPTDFGEIDSLVDTHFDAALSSFIERGLSSLLCGRPLHTSEVDLLHVIAMAIHPSPSEQPIRATAKELEEKGSKVWEEAKLKMVSLHPHNFCLNYRHRKLLVKLVVEHLIIPEANSDRITSSSVANGSSSIHSPLFEGALPHLRASLYAFGMAAQSPLDMHWSQCGLISIAVQSGEKVVVHEEWGRLLNRLMDDRTHYSCTNSCTRGNRRPQRHTLSLMTAKEDATSFCPHCARGQLLELFISRFSESRQYADHDFLQYTMSSLADAIEFKVDDWTQANEEDDPDEHPSSSKGGDEKLPEADADAEVAMKVDTGDQQTESTENPHQHDDNEPKNSKEIQVHTTSEPPCVLASLLVAARPIFYFLLPHTKDVDSGTSEEETEDSQRRDMLVSCGIQLLHHWNEDIALEASQLLVLSFCYGPTEMMKDYGGAVFESTKLAISQALKKGSKCNVAPVEILIAALSTKEPKFGEVMLELLLSLDSTTTEDALIINRLIAAVAMACPTAAHRQRHSLLKRMSKPGTPVTVQAHLIAGLLACRRAHFFNKGNDDIKECLEGFLSSEGGGWSSYMLARQSLVSGSFDAAELLYKELALVSTSEQSFLWLSTLQKVAGAESTLLCDGTLGIPSATMKLRSANVALHNLPSLSRFPNVSFAFQKRLLQLRLDFLELVGAIRQLASEMRLANVGPKKYTRPRLHLRNAVKALEVLSIRYLTLYRRYGLFTCQQSRTTLRTLHTMCRFVASAVRYAFHDELQDASVGNHREHRALILPKGDANHPLSVLMIHMEAAVLKNLSNSLEAKIRAAALLQVFDGVLKIPIPFPRTFIGAKSLHSASLQVSVDFEFYEDGDDYVDEDVELAPGNSITFCASGTIPEALVQQARIPFYVVLLWYTITFRAAVKESGGDDNDALNDKAVENSSQSSAARTLNGGAEPTAVSLPPSGCFSMKIESDALLEAGLYSIEARLGCRDVRGGEWEFPSLEGTTSFTVRVSSSG